jgi:uncharacterized membrane protein
MNKQKGSLLFVITLGFVILAVLIAMIMIATNSIKEKQNNNQTQIQKK